LKIDNIPYIDTWSTISFYFDENQNGIIDDPEDYILCEIPIDEWSMRAEFLDKAISNSPPYDPDDIDLGGTMDVFGSISHSNPTWGETGSLCLEFAHRLDSNDDYDVSFTPGSLAGFGIEYYNAEGFVQYSWPTGVKERSGWNRMITLEIASPP